MKRQQGFTLIEVMVVLVIAAILASIAFPTYTDSVRKARRAEAKAEIVRQQIEEEKHRVDNPQYKLIATVSTSYYDITGTPKTGFEATHYEIVANAKKDQANDVVNGTACNVLKLTVANGSEDYTPAACW